MEIMGVMPINKSVLTVAEAASALSVSSNTVYKLLDSGTIKASKIGRSWKIPVESIDAVMRQK
ncbi:helix-turn-helix domain-containing protein [uncultured Anaerovibrio sp.]|uniref:helix-turn-helix domain-containing protein n=1 Tax=uncultured Anaerovibrio sp. TaxID=361586 RepID=UPI0025E1E708|nr:helix-turn-helix domain-containing protein [uncultured Anaerovibrio sp.]